MYLYPSCIFNIKKQNNSPLPLFYFVFFSTSKMRVHNEVSQFVCKTVTRCQSLRRLIAWFSINSCKHLVPLMFSFLSGCTLPSQKCFFFLKHLQTIEICRSLLYSEKKFKSFLLYPTICYWINLTSSRKTKDLWKKLSILCVLIWSSTPSILFLYNFCHSNLWTKY